MCAACVCLGKRIDRSFVIFSGDIFHQPQNIFKWKSGPNVESTRDVICMTAHIYRNYRLNSNIKSSFHTWVLIKFRMDEIFVVPFNAVLCVCRIYLHSNIETVWNAFWWWFRAMQAINLIMWFCWIGCFDKNYVNNNWWHRRKTDRTWHYGRNRAKLTHTQSVSLSLSHSLVLTHSHTSHMLSGRK